MMALYNGDNVALVLTGPSGSGKTTYSRMLRDFFGKQIGHNITYTTRNKREKESNPEYFVFLSEEEFDKLSKKNMFFCETTFCGNKYAYRTSDLLSELSKHDVVLDSIFPIPEIRDIAKYVFIIFLSCPKNELLDRIISRTPEMDKEEFLLRLENVDIQENYISFCDLVVNTGNNVDTHTVFNAILEAYLQYRDIVKEGE